MDGNIDATSPPSQWGANRTTFMADNSGTDLKTSAYFDLDTDDKEYSY